MPVQWQRENFWLYGALESATGEHFFYSFSHVDSVYFEQFIQMFRATLSALFILIFWQLNHLLKKYKLFRKEY